MLLARGCASHLPGALWIRPQAHMAASSTGYTTLAEAHSNLLEVKHSKFLTNCWPARNAQEVEPCPRLVLRQVAASPRLACRTGTSLH